MLERCSIPLLRHAIGTILLVREGEIMACYTLYAWFWTKSCGL